MVLLMSGVRLPLLLLGRKPLHTEVRMTDEEISRLLTERTAIADVLALSSKFLHYLHASNPAELFGTLTVTEDAIAVNCCGYNISASPRVVRGPSGNYFVEYPFRIAFEEDSLLVWAIYFHRGGRIYMDCQNDDANLLCDYDNMNLRKIILTNLMDKILKSEIFKPSK